jgi:1,4-alpha-glucan branching enzyme
MQIPQAKTPQSTTYRGLGQSQAAGTRKWWVVVSRCDRCGSPGHQHKFVIRNPEFNEPLWKNDAYACNLTNSAGNSIIVDSSFEWKEGIYSMPSWNELVVYELH